MKGKDIPKSGPASLKERSGGAGNSEGEPDRHKTRGEITSRPSSKNGRVEKDIA